VVNTQIDPHDVETWSDADISDVLDALTHDVNNIVQSVQGNAQLMRLILRREGEISPEMLERLIDVFLRRTEDLNRLMKNTRCHSQRLRYDGQKVEV